MARNLGTLLESLFGDNSRTGLQQIGLRLCDDGVPTTCRTRMGQAVSSQKVLSSHSRRTMACEMAVAEFQKEPQSVVAERSIESASVVLTQPQSVSCDKSSSVIAEPQLQPQPQSIQRNPLSLPMLTSQPLATLRSVFQQDFRHW